MDDSTTFFITSVAAERRSVYELIPHFSNLQRFISFWFYIISQLMNVEWSRSRRQSSMSMSMSSDVDSIFVFVYPSVGRWNS